MDYPWITHGLSMDNLYIGYPADRCPRAHFLNPRVSLARLFFAYCSIFLISSFGVLFLLSPAMDPRPPVTRMQIFVTGGPSLQCSPHTIVYTTSRILHPRAPPKPHKRFCPMQVFANLNTHYNATACMCLVYTFTQ